MDKETKISIHAPAKGATSPLTLYLHAHRFQSTLPRRERHLISDIEFSFLGISIHAPAKGATKLTKINIKIFVNFNPRSREGSDLRLRPPAESSIFISIHAPAKGATCPDIYVMFL